MDIVALVLFVIVAFSLIVGIMVLLVDLKRYASWLFFLLIISMDLWMLFGNQSNVGDLGFLSTDILLRLDFVFGVVTAYLFFLFCHTFPRRLDIDKRVVISLGLLTLVFSVLVFTDLLIRETYFSSEGSSYMSGLLDYPFVIFIALMMGLGIKGLFAQLKSKDLNQIVQARYTAFAAILPVIIILVSLFLGRLINTFWGWSELTLSIIPNFSRFSLLVFVVVTAYAIVRHQYLGIRIAFGRMILWFGASGMLFLVYYLVVFVELKLFGTFMSFPVLLLNGILSFMVALLFGAYEKTMRKFIDRKVWRFDLNIDEIVEQYKQDVEVLQEPEETVEVLFKMVKGLLNVEKQGIFYALSGVKNEVSYTRWDNFSQEDITILEDQEGINLLLENLESQEPIMRQDLMGLQVFEKQFQLLKAVGIDAVVPFNKDGLFGAYLLSLKSSSNEQGSPTKLERNFAKRVVEVSCLSLNRYFHDKIVNSR